MTEPDPGDRAPEPPPRPEFSRPVTLARIGREGQEVAIEAAPKERAALARRYAIPAVDALLARFRLSPAEDGSVLAEGSLEAVVVQDCVVTLEPVEQSVAEAFALRLLPPGRAPSDGPEEIDEIPVTARGVADLGELAAEQLALALDPYPRAPGASLPPEATADADPEAGAKDERFAALAALRRR